jgi:hypothetical protein
MALILSPTEFTAQVALIRAQRRATRHVAENRRWAVIREQMCRDSLAALRRFALLKPGGVQTYVLGIVGAQEVELGSV